MNEGQTKNKLHFKLFLTTKLIILKTRQNAFRGCLSFTFATYRSFKFFKIKICPLNFICVFDLLKNKRLDKTTSDVLYLILKLFLGLDKLGTRQKLKFLFLTEPRYNF
jgi:hypothetical protein